MAEFMPHQIEPVVEIQPSGIAAMAPVMRPWSAPLPGSLLLVAALVAPPAANPQSATQYGMPLVSPIAIGAAAPPNAGNSFQSFFRTGVKNQLLALRWMYRHRRTSIFAVTSAAKRTYASLCLLPFAHLPVDNVPSICPLVTPPVLQRVLYCVAAFAFGHD